MRRRIRTTVSRWWWIALGAVGLSHARWLALPKLTRRTVKAVVWIGIGLIAIAVFGVWESTALLAAIVLLLLVVPWYDRLTIAGRPVGKFLVPLAVIAIAAGYPYYGTHMPQLPILSLDM